MVDDNTHHRLISAYFTDNLTPVRKYAYRTGGHSPFETRALADPHLTLSRDAVYDLDFVGH
ncbi:Uncharacterised protein [Vibrio cholerae]|nr:Uncharacterised protein [Vibrio cholerae]